MKLSGFLVLLLTLLSCNSAKDTTATRNAIASEAQLQQMNVILYDNGNRYVSNIREELSTTPKNEELIYKSNTLSLLINRMNEIDSLTADIIYSIDQLKSSLLKAAGESYTVNPEHTGLPTPFDFTNLKNASNTDAASEIGLDSDSPDGKGMEVFNQFKRYRNALVKITGSTALKQLAVKDINEYTTEADLIEKIRTQITSKAPNFRDDQELLTDVYKLLTLPNKIGDKPWVVNSFEHSSLIGALSTLTILQNKILQARVFALAHISSKINSCGYGFNKIIPFAQGPSIVHEGETAEITVGIAAFDSYNQPGVTLESMEGEVLKPEKGTGKVRVKPKKGLQKITGTVSIKNKSGVKKTMDWEWNIRVLPKK